MTGLVEFLRARADEEDNEIRICRDLELAPGQIGGEAGTWTPDGYWERALAGVEARRRIIDRYQDVHWHAPAIPGATYPELREEETGACRTCVTNKLLALPHSDHPDYRPEWRP